MAAASCMRVRSVIFAMCLSCQGCSHDKIYVGPVTIITADFEVNNGHRAPVSTSLQVQAVSAQKYCEAQYIASEINSARNSTNASGNSQKIKVNASLNMNVRLCGKINNCCG